MHEDNYILLGVCAVVALISFVLVDWWLDVQMSPQAYDNWEGPSIISRGSATTIKLARDQSAKIDLAPRDCKSSPKYEGKISVIQGPALIGIRNNLRDLWSKLVPKGYEGDLPRPEKVDLCEDIKSNRLFVYAPQGDVVVVVKDFLGVRF